jgi:hypothetical protein
MFFEPFLIIHFQSFFVNGLLLCAIFAAEALQRFAKP